MRIPSFESFENGSERLRFGFKDLVNFDGGIICAGMDAFHAIVADLFRIEIAFLTFAAVIADFVIIQQAALFFHAYPSPLKQIYYSAKSDKKQAKAAGFLRRL